MSASIREILQKYGEDARQATWQVQGKPVIYHDVLERIAARAGIEWEMPTIVRAEKDDAAILVAARLDGRLEWSVGEAAVGTNYRISGKQAAYPWAMAEKRAKDRVILKLIGLHGLLYSEEEADEFKNSREADPEPGRQRVAQSAGKGGREYLDEDRRDERQAKDFRRAALEAMREPDPQLEELAGKTPDEDARAYISMAKTAMLNATTSEELSTWWRDEAGRRREYGIVKGTKLYDELVAASQARADAINGRAAA